jgi:hypothetical protein
MSATPLDTPFLDGALRSTNYFNGRILSREDMQRDRDAARALQERLGLALGHGIVSGFGVEARAIGGSSITSPVVTVHAGLAVNRNGDTVALDRDVDVLLLQPAGSAASSSSGTAAAVTPAAGSFTTCAPPDDAVYVTGTGVYLLTIAPAATTQGLALVSGLGNASASCNASELVEGVQFRLLQMTGLSGVDLADDAHLRNVAAYRFLLADLGEPNGGADVARDPFGTASAASAASAVTDPALTDCDIPIALLNWTATGGLRWVDRWAVQRRLAPIAASAPPAALVGAGRLRAAEAALLQFEGHLRDLAATGTPTELAVASQIFRYLPAAGVLPLSGLGASAGFDRLTFFGDRTTRGPLVVEGAVMRALLRASLDRPPIDLGERELIWIYLVRQNLQAQGTGADVQPYFVFATGQLPPFGAARLDVARAGFANVAVM